MTERRRNGDAPTAPMVVVNMMPAVVTGFALERRLAEARSCFLASDQPLTLRALGTFDPGVLWGILRHLEDLPVVADTRPVTADGVPIPANEELAAERAKLVGRVRKAKAEGRDDLVQMATAMFDEARDRLTGATARSRRAGTAKESARRRRLVLRQLVAGLPDWSLTDIARLVLESPAAWKRPPCPTFAAKYRAESGDPMASVAYLADLFRQDLKR